MLYTLKSHIAEHIRLEERTPEKILADEQGNYREAFHQLSVLYSTAVMQLGWAARDLLHTHQVLGIDKVFDEPAPCQTPFAPAEAACEVES